MGRFACKSAVFTALAIVTVNILAAEGFNNGGVEIPTDISRLSSQAFQPKLDCHAHGTPIDFPDDILVTNEGPGTVRAGTRIRWRMESGNDGTYALPALAPKESTYIFAVNPGGISTGSRCTAGIVRGTGARPVR